MAARKLFGVAIQRPGVVVVYVLHALIEGLVGVRMLVAPESIAERVALTAAPEWQST